MNEAFPDAPYPPLPTNGHIPPTQKRPILPPVPFPRGSALSKTHTHSPARQPPAPAAKPNALLRGKKNEVKTKTGMKTSNSTAKKHSMPESGLKPPARKLQASETRIPESGSEKDIPRLSFGWPLAGNILKNYAQTGKKGIKIAGKKGQAVRAAEGGKVVYSGQGLIGYGNLLIIKHNDQYLTAYANNNALLAKEGDVVKKGQEIATVGVVGASRRAMLHFEIRKRGKSVNPLAILPKL
ncbi:MAG: murein hydrolase activator EnvC family protein [Methylomicrobium sp.]